MSRRRACTIGVIGLVGGGIAWAVVGLHSTTDVPALEVHFVYDGYSDSPLVRYGENGNLLITRYFPEPGNVDIALPQHRAPVRNFQGPADRGLVYEYDAEKRQLKEVPVNLWNGARSRIVKGHERRGELIGRGTGVFDGKLQIRLDKEKPRQLGTVGDVVFKSMVSPDGRFLAALTTSGWKRPKLSSWYFPLGGGHWGQHYVEIFDVRKDLQRKAVKIPFTTAQGIETLTWSEDGRLIVVSTTDRRWICVLHVDIDPKPKRKREPNRKGSDE